MLHSHTGRHKSTTYHDDSQVATRVDSSTSPLHVILAWSELSPRKTSSALRSDKRFTFQTDVAINSLLYAERRTDCESDMSNPVGDKNQSSLSDDDVGSVGNWPFDAGILHHTLARDGALPRGFEREFPSLGPMTERARLPHATKGSRLRCKFRSIQLFSSSWPQC